MNGGLGSARLAVLVHEVRSPVAALSAVTAAVAENEDGSMRMDLVRLALVACRSIERIVMDVALTSVRGERLDVGSLAREAVASFAVRGANVVAVVDDDQHMVDADPVRLRQAVDNLVTNAVVHGSDTAVTVRVSRAAEYVEIAITDDGPGIAPEDLERIFEHGARLDDSTPGSGFGLTLTRAIVDAHGGALTVESTPDDGSTFTIALPAASAQPATWASSS